MDASKLQQLEGFAEQFFNGTGDTQKAAQQALAPFSEAVEYTGQLKFILDNSQSVWAQMFAASCLRQLVDWHWNAFELQTRVDIRNYVLTLLDEKGPMLEGFVRDALVQLLCRITKLGWFDEVPQQQQQQQQQQQGADSSVKENVHRSTAQQVSTFFRPDSPAHSAIGLSILTRLVVEFGKISVNQSLTSHRKSVISFRDTSLLQIFKLSIITLRAINSNTVTAAEQTMVDVLKKSALELAHLCLTYDFVGTSPSESTEDEATVKIPVDWRTLFQDSRDLTATPVLDLFWDMYTKSEPPHTAKAMEILVELASVRRSLFTEEESRDAYLARIMNGITDILRTERGLNDSETFHQFCRLLARLKGNYQLNQIASAEGYGDWLRLVALFSIASLRHWEHSPNSMYYILTLWSRLVAAIPYLHTKSSTTLEIYAPQILDAFVVSRLASVQLLVEQGEEDPFDPDENLLFEQLDALPYMGRLRYEQTSQLLQQRLDPLQHQYQEMIRTSFSGASLEQQALVEGQLAWLIYIIGAVIGGRVTTNATDEHNLLDAELGARIFKLLSLYDSVLAQTQLTSSKARLDMALLQFLSEFRKVYVGDTSVGSIKMFERLQDLMGMQDSNMVLNVMMQKILTDLKVWYQNKEVVDQCLQLFFDLATGYSSVRLMVKLPTIVDMMSQHDSRQFPFLDQDKNSRARVLWYSTLAKFLNMLDDTDTRRRFMLPFKTVLDVLLQQNDPVAFQQPQCQQHLYRVLLDLNGFLQGTYNRTSFERFWHWFYPVYFPVLHAASEIWWKDERIPNALLKFLCELSANKSGRISFDCSSADGILLFKECAKLITTYGRLLLTYGSDVQGDQLWPLKLRPITYILKVLANGLQGNYCCFGVFTLYGDPCLQDSVATALQLSLGVELDDLLSFPKLTRQFFHLIDRLSHHHIEHYGALSTDQFARILYALQMGITFSEVGVSTQACMALDHIATFFLERKLGMASELDWQRVSKLCVENMQIFGSILHSLFLYLLFDECPNQWSTSRPIFSIICMCPNSLDSFKDLLMRRQSPANQQLLAQCFDALMVDVKENLESKTRDIFTQNLNTFRTRVREFITMDQVI